MNKAPKVKLLIKKIADELDYLHWTASVFSSSFEPSDYSKQLLESRLSELKEVLKNDNK